MHSMTIKEVMSALEQFAPLPLQESYDNAGLQVGLTETEEVSGALLCLDVTEAVVDEAIQLGCNLIISHHPLIFQKLRHITDENYVQRTVRKAIKNDVGILSMHTNLDAAEGGVNFEIAHRLGLKNIKFFGKQQEICGVNGGEGVIGEMQQTTTADDFVKIIKETFHVDSLQCNQLLQRPIQKVALCGGAGSFLLEEAIAAGADAFLTGEMSYHAFFGHEQEIQICVMGHYQSEQYTPLVLQRILAERFPQLTTHITSINTNPIQYF